MTAPKSLDTIEVPLVGTILVVEGTGDDVWRFRYVNKDGSWCVFGGDRNPNLTQSFRSFRVERCSLPVVKVKKTRKKKGESSE